MLFIVVLNIMVTNHSMPSGSSTHQVNVGAQAALEADPLKLRPPSPDPHRQQLARDDIGTAPT